MMAFDPIAGGLVFVAAVSLTMIRQAVTARWPALEGMRTTNAIDDAAKLALPKYPPMVAASARVGKWTTLAFLLGVTPFVTTRSPHSVVRIVVDTVALLMLYDLAYYVTHRFVFHGSLMREIHAVHHQARRPSYIDAHYVHPVETFVGIALFIASVIAVANVQGRLHVLTVVIGFMAFTQLNQLNHTRMGLGRFPFRTADWISAKHAAHHENMRKGNYATITLFYDWLFGTLE